MSVGPAVSAPKGAPAFELAESALEPGRMLIEASAGTGKTYALAGLVLRLVVEAGLTIRQILTVTFTEAATAELRDRIRRRLVEGWRAFGAGHAQDALLRALLAKPAVVAAEARDRLWQALLDFDEAPIHTIHAFCQRVLETHAFETGQPFGMELVTDSAPLLEAVARDWWRRRLYGAGPIHVLAALDADLTVAELAARLEDVLKRPGATLLTGAEGLSLEQHGRALEAEYAAMRLLWGYRRGGDPGTLRCGRQVLGEQAVQPGRVHDADACADRPVVRGGRVGRRRDGLDPGFHTGGACEGDQGRPAASTAPVLRPMRVLAGGRPDVCRGAAA
ncbi:MAG: UvrD-helicase domain-containing protein [Verrucomicrobia bacterium]|nr:UvrD-helicase domain-containing protein [Verrucomicrobiota bacterium]